MKMRIFVLVIFLELCFFDTHSQNNYTLSVANTAICLPRNNTKFTLNVKLISPTTSCQITSYKIFWGDSKDSTYTYNPNVTDHQHEYDFKNFVESCSEYVERDVKIETNNINCKSNITPVFFYNSPSPSFTANRALPCIGQEVIFSPNACPNSSNTTYLWEYDDGSIPDNKGRHTFNKTGVFSVKLTVKNDCGTASIIKSITIIDQAKAAVKDSGFVAIRADTSIYCLSNGRGVIRLDGTVSTNATEYEWVISPPGSVTFLDRTNRFSPRPKLQFNGTGNYSIELTVKNDCGIPNKIKCFHKVEELPILTITPQNDACEDINYKIPNYFKGATYTLNGNPITENQTISITKSNQVNVVEAKITTVCGTQIAKDSFYVSAPQIAKITSFRDTSVCVGSNPLSLSTNLSTGTWTGQFIENQQRFRPSSIGIYWLKVATPLLGSKLHSVV